MSRRGDWDIGVSRVCVNFASIRGRMRTWCAPDVVMVGLVDAPLDGRLWQSAGLWMAVALDGSWMGCGSWMGHGWDMGGSGWCC